VQQVQRHALLFPQTDCKSDAEFFLTRFSDLHDKNLEPDTDSINIVMHTLHFFEETCEGLDL